MDTLGFYSLVLPWRNLFSCFFWVWVLHTATTINYNKQSITNWETILLLVGTKKLLLASKRMSTCSQHKGGWQWLQVTHDGRQRWAKKIEVQSKSCSRKVLALLKFYFQQTNLFIYKKEKKKNLKLEECSQQNCNKKWKLQLAASSRKMIIQTGVLCVRRVKWLLGYRKPRGRVVEWLYFFLLFAPL